MTKEELKDILYAMIEGKEIEVYDDRSKTWITLTKPLVLDIKNAYRIKKTIHEELVGIIHDFLSFHKIKNLDNSYHIEAFAHDISSIFENYGFGRSKLK